MDQTKKAQRFHDLHIPGNPLVLCNIWDAGGAQVVAQAGAPAIATGSWAVARAQGYGDGQDIPLDLVMTILGRIVASVDLPVTLDFEAGYATDLDTLKSNISRILSTDAIGINFEDQVMNAPGLVPIDEQCDRISALRDQAKADGIDLFINARTDVFFKDAPRDQHRALLPAAIERAQAYAAAGASGIFVPGLMDISLIRALCTEISLPVNVMKIGDAAPVADLGDCGVARISQGPGPYRATMDLLAQIAGSAA